MEPQGQILVHGGKVFLLSPKNVEGADGGEWTKLPEKKVNGFAAFWDKLEGKDVALVSVQEAAQESSVMAALYASA